MKPEIPLFALLFVLSAPLLAQDEKISFFDLLPADDLLKMELSLNLDSLEEKVKTNDYIPATLSFTDKNGQDQLWELKVRARGKFRRTRCAFPPLRLEFDKDDLRKQNMHTFDSYKLVTHCVEGDEGKDNVMRECLVYRLYEVVNPEQCIRTRPVRVKYKDTGSGRRIVQYAAILEDEKEVSRRLQSKECEACYSLPPKAFDREMARRHALFQYMIGNHDWAVNTLRNILVLNPKDSSDKIIIPYDFDFAGIVATAYAVNSINIPAEACGGRVYLGFENSLEELDGTIQYFQSIREELETTIWKFRWLNGSSRRAMLQYLDQFYDCINSGNVVFMDKSSY